MFDGLTCPDCGRFMTTGSCIPCKSPAQSAHKNVVVEGKSIRPLNDDDRLRAKLRKPSWLEFD